GHRRSRLVPALHRPLGALRDLRAAHLRSLYLEPRGPRSLPDAVADTLALADAVLPVPHADAGAFLRVDPHATPDQYPEALTRVGESPPSARSWHASIPPVAFPW